ncbi:hypothetical protein C8T65DRAFT_79648 [Cerioporus squamosus]|nr:hypothetical protein C8T65DRAFT_79648 [Cerioporus squamosus]
MSSVVLLQVASHQTPVSPVFSAWHRVGGLLRLRPAWLFIKHRHGPRCCLGAS